MLHDDPNTQLVGTERGSSAVRIDPRFEGALPGHANGGIVAGSLAQHLPTAGSVHVRLHRPVPLGTSLALVRVADAYDLHGHGQVLATGRPAGPQGDAAIDRLAASAHAIAPSVAARTTPAVDAADHPAPRCFVCGPARRDGLDLQPGRVGVRELVATVWRPTVDLAVGGVVAMPFVWAALDCPSWYGAARGRPALLGTIVARCLRPLPVEQPAVVTGWRQHAEGRRTQAASAIHTGDGDLVAIASATWIHPEEHDR